MFGGSVGGVGGAGVGVGGVGGDSGGGGGVGGGGVVVVNVLPGRCFLALTHGGNALQCHRVARGVAGKAGSKPSGNINIQNEETKI